jgi:hypothetical protein
LFGFIGELGDSNEKSVIEAGIKGLIGKTENSAGFLFSIAPSGNADGNRLAGKAIILFRQHVKTVFNPRFANELGIFGYLVSLFLKIFPELVP